MSLTTDIPTEAKAQPGSVSFTLNDKAVSVAADGERSLLSVLREDFGCKSLKNGCEPQASCGCCTLLIDGKPRLSCTMKPEQAAGKTLVTLEGLPEQERKNIADSFVSCGGVQCGFCIPGMAMRGYATVCENAKPSREQIAFDLRGHLCRCTGYVKIIDAIETYAKAKRGEGLPVFEESGKVGTSLKRYRGHELVLGDFKYIDDIEIEGSLYAAMRFSEHPRALVKGIDASAALAMDGVERVITAADVPGDRHVGLIIHDWPILVAIGEETRCVGDIIAIVVAKDQYTARKAAEKIVVDYEVRKPVATVDDALKPDAPKIHAKGNLLSKSGIVKGNPDAAFASSAHIVEDTFQTQRIEHMFLEPESCIAIPFQNAQTKEQNLRLFSQGEGIFDDRAVRERAGMGQGAHCGRACAERRRVWGQGGHEHSGADVAGGGAVRSAGEMHLDAR